MGKERSVITYVGDNQDVLTKISEIATAHRQLANNTITNFDKTAQVLGKSMGQITQNFKLDPVTQEFTALESETRKYSDILKNTEGDLVKFTESQKIVKGTLKKVSHSFSDLSDAQTKAVTKVHPLIGKSSQLATNFSNLSDINQKYSHQLVNVGQGTFVLDRQLLKASATTKTFGTTLATSQGNIVQLTETVKRLPNGIQEVTRSFKDVTTSHLAHDKVTKQLNTSTVSLAGNVARLAYRAALTIPLWLALRGAIMGVIRGFTGGVKDLIEFDKALQKLRKNLQGTPEEIERNFQSAQKAITDFSIISGKSTEDITKAIQKFATVGFDFESSMQAGMDATRLSVLLFGEAEETANAFARGLRALATDVKDTAKTQDEIGRALALTSELWETNAFELGELNQGLEKFAGTAKSMNFTIEETLVLLAGLSTRGLNANRAGTLLRTTTAQLEANLSKLGKILGVEVNPEVDRTFDVFMRVVNAIAKLKKETISPELSNAIGELFGGVRGGEPIRALLADIDGINESFEKFANVRPDIVKMRNDFDKMNDTLFGQQRMFGNLGREAWKALLLGITGGKEFKESLASINRVLEANIPNIKEFGGNIRQTAIYLKQAIEWGLKFVDVMTSLSVFNQASQMLSLAKGIERTEKLLTDSKEAADAFAKSLKMALDGKDIDNTNLVRLLEGIVTRINIDSIDPQIDRPTLIKAFERLIHDESQLGFVELDKLAVTVTGLKTPGVSKEVWEHLSNHLRHKAAEAFLKDPINIEAKTKIEIDPVYEKTRQEKAAIVLSHELDRLKILGASNIELLKAQNIYDKMLGIHREENDLLQNKLNLEGAKLEQQQQKISIVLKHELDRLKNLGASNLELLKAENIYSKMLGIHREEKDLLQNKLDLERAMAEEKRLQSRLGSDTIKLFRIAQEQGVDMSRKISDVLSGEVDFSDFIRLGGQAVDVFKKEFGSIFEQQKAMAFFKGETMPGFQSLRGGRGIRIQEEAIRQPLRRTDVMRTALREGDVLPTRTAEVAKTLTQTNNIENHFNVTSTNKDETIAWINEALSSPQIKQRLAQIVLGDNQTRVF